MYQILSWQRASRQHKPYNNTEFLSLACTPIDESCTQAGEDITLQLMECTALINQLQRMYGQPPENARFFIVENDHEFGMYYEAGIFYEAPQEEPANFDEKGNIPEDWLRWWEEGEDSTPSLEYANKVETLPEKWDEEAIKELRQQGYFNMKQAPAKVIALQQGARSKAK